MSIDPAILAALPRFADTYRATHDGRDPYTDLWAWAEAIVRWHQEQDPPRFRYRLDDCLQVDHLVAAVAESLRINMGLSEKALGDLDLSMLESELRNWSEAKDEDGSTLTPDGSGWPAPTGPHAVHWHALMHVLVNDPDRRIRIHRSVFNAFLCLTAHAITLPHLVNGAYSAMLDYRLSQAPGPRVDYRSLAEVAPSLGISPVPVRDPHWYEGFSLITAAETD